MTYPLFFFLFWSPSPCFSSLYFTLSHLFFRCISIPLSIPLLFPDYIYTYICYFISIGLITSFSLPSPFLPHFVSSPPPLSIFLFLSLSIPSPSYPFSPTLSFFSLSLPLIHPFLPPPPLLPCISFSVSYFCLCATALPCLHYSAVPSRTVCLP